MKSGDKLGKFIDLTGQKFGILTVLERALNKGKRTTWRCVCECGTVKDIIGASLTSGTTKSCGCLKNKKRGNNFIDLTGMKFGRLTAIEPVKHDNSTAAFWKCKCDCGNTVEVYGYSLRAKNGTRSCGCLQKEIASDRHFEDLTGQRFGDNITVIKRVEDKKRKDKYGNKVQWLCQSDGGEYFISDPYVLKNCKHHIEKIFFIPEMKKFFDTYSITEEDMKKYAPHSNKTITAICPQCGRAKEISPDRLLRQGLGCSCSDHISYIEKFMISFLKDHSIEFKYQKTFPWSNRKIYDFYIEKYNIIIEPGGIQHILGWGNKVSSEEINQNDIMKRDLAIQNGMNYFYFICTSNLSDIKDNIINCKDQNCNNLLDVLNINASKIDWNEYAIYATKNLVIEVCDMWNNGFTIVDIVNKINLANVTIIDYLKRGAEIGWCNYQAGCINNRPNVNKIKEINNNIEYPSIRQASRELNISRNQIKKSIKENIYVLNDKYKFEII